MPAPMPMPNPIRRELIHKLRVDKLDVTPVAMAKAVRENHVESVRAILQAGGSPDASDASGCPVLLIACENEASIVAHELLEAGADANAPAGDGNTALMIAAERGNVPLLEDLLLHCAAIDATDARGRSALHHAVLARSSKTVCFLLDQGAPAMDESRDGSILDQALYTWDTSLIGPVLKCERRSQPMLWSKASRDVLYAAIHIQDKPMLELLLRNHDVPPTPEGFREPLLGYLIAWNYPTAFSLLLNCGADPNTPIETPAEPAFSKLIPDENVRFYMQKERGMNVLMLAAALGRTGFVEHLLQHGARRGAVTRHYRMAAVQFAARANHPDAIQVLLGKSPRPEDQHVRIDISLGQQRAMLWKDDRMVVSAPISTGRTGFPTPHGRFVVTDKERNRYSSIYKVSMPWFMRLSCSEFGMHAGVVPNYPASHGCIRLPPGAALSFYRYADLGTLVNIEP